MSLQSVSLAIARWRNRREPTAQNGERIKLFEKIMETFYWLESFKLKLSVSKEQINESIGTGQEGQIFEVFHHLAQSGALQNDLVVIGLQNVFVSVLVLI